MCSVNEKLHEKNEYGYISQSFIQLLNNYDSRYSSAEANTVTQINSDNFKYNNLSYGTKSIIGVNACCSDEVKLKNLIDESDRVWQHILVSQLKKNAECKESTSSSCVGDERNKEGAPDANAIAEAQIGSYILAHCASSTCQSNVTETRNSEDYYNNHENRLKDEKSGIEFRVEIDVDHVNGTDGNANCKNDDNNNNDGEGQTFTHDEAERFQRKLQSTTEPLRNCMQLLQFRDNFEESELIER